MSEAVSRRYHPLLAWLLLLLVLLTVIFFLIVPALVKSSELDDQIESGYSRLNKMRQVAQATPEFMAEYERVRQQGLDKLFYPEGMTAAQVGKELQKQLSTVVASQNGLLLSSEVVDQIESQQEDEQASRDYQRVTVQANFQGSTGLLRQILHEAYRSRPLIFVDSLEAKPSNSEDGGQVLKGTVKISTYWRGGADNHEKTD